MRNAYTPQEEATVVYVYVNTKGTRRERGELASLLCPGNTHSQASWNAQIGRLEALDKRNETASRFGVSQSLRNAAESIAPHIFC